MGATKHEIYSEEINNYAELFKALGHPARIKAMLIIANETDKDVSASEIHQQIKLSQSTLSVHLKQLRDSGLVMTKLSVRDTKCCLTYRINMESIARMDKYFEHLKNKSRIKSDDRFDDLSTFFTKLRELTKWNQQFDA
jgi:ArsR family transcriptional regulator